KGFAVLLGRVGFRYREIITAAGTAVDRRSNGRRDVPAVSLKVAAGAGVDAQCSAVINITTTESPTGGCRGITQIIRRLVQPGASYGRSDRNRNRHGPTVGERAPARRCDAVITCELLKQSVRGVGLSSQADEQRG